MIGQAVMAVRELIVLHFPSENVRFTVEALLELSEGSLRRSEIREALDELEAGGDVMKFVVAGRAEFANIMPVLS